MSQREPERGRAPRRLLFLSVAAALLVGLAPPAVASAITSRGELILASVTEEGVNGGSNAEEPSMSAGGTRVAFHTGAENLDPRDTDDIWDIYVKDLVSGKLLLASTSDAGVKGNGDSHNPSLSADGTKVAFDSVATNLDPADTEADEDVYVKDLVTGGLTLASTSDTTTGTKGNGDSYEPSISGDGTRVAFKSQATNFDSRDQDEGVDIYVKDLTNGEVTLASASSGGIHANGPSEDADISTDGMRVAFQSDATNLHPGDRDTIEDIFLKDLTTGRVLLVSATASGVKANSGGALPDISGSGLAVAFLTYSTNLDARDRDEHSDIYLKNLVTGELVLASTSPSGIKGNSQTTHPSVSADGSRVAFESDATNLHPRDRDVQTDAYVKDLHTGAIYLASTSSFGVKGNDLSELPSLGARGDRVAFDSRARNLHPLDDDIAHDIYVKHLG